METNQPNKTDIFLVNIILLNFVSMVLRLREFLLTMTYSVMFNMYRIYLIRKEICNVIISEIIEMLGQHAGK